MKTKEELLKKYEGTEFYGAIKAHYGSKQSFQHYDGGLLNFDENAMKDIVGAEKLTYPEFIDIQIQTGKDYRRLVIGRIFEHKQDRDHQLMPYPLKCRRCIEACNG